MAGRQVQRQQWLLAGGGGGVEVLLHRGRGGQGAASSATRCECAVTGASWSSAGCASDASELAGSPLRLLRVSLASGRTVDVSQTKPICRNGLIGLVCGTTATPAASLAAMQPSHSICWLAERRDRLHAALHVCDYTQRGPLCTTRPSQNQDGAGKAPYSISSMPTKAGSRLHDN